MNTGVLLSGLRGETSAERAFAISQLTADALADPQICDAVLELATDTRVPATQPPEEPRSIADLAQARLVQLAPASSAWTRAADLRIAIDPGCAAWLAPIGRPSPA